MNSAIFGIRKGWRRDSVSSGPVRSPAPATKKRASASHRGVSSTSRRRAATRAAAAAAARRLPRSDLPSCVLFVSPLAAAARALPCGDVPVRAGNVQHHALERRQQR